jgi:NADH-quinone oxidoreductase subunit N
VPLQTPWLAQALVLVAGLASLLAAIAHPKTRIGPVEHFLLVGGSLVGLCVLCTAAHFLELLVGAEIASLCAYVLVGQRKEHRPSAEAAVKYLLFGAVTTGLMLFGFSLLYGLTGTLHIASSMSALQAPATPAIPAFIALSMAMSGFLFKTTAAPFHFWAPDAYQAATPNAAGFLSTVPKMAGLVVLLRVVDALVLATPATSPSGANGPLAGFTGGSILNLVVYALAVLSIGSLLIGNLGALWQRDFRRLLGYSAVAHAGFLLMGLATLPLQPRQAAAGLLLYLLSYLVFNLGAFIWAGVLERAAGHSRFNEWPGQVRIGNGLLVALVVSMVGLAGLPPTVGFIAKLNVFLPVWQAYELTGNWLFPALVVLGILNTVASLAYYLRVPALLIFKRVPTVPGATVARLTWVEATLLAVLLGTGLLLGVWGFDAVLQLMGA